VGHQEDVDVLLMEYLEGESLAEQFAKRIVAANARPYFAWTHEL